MKVFISSVIAGMEEHRAAAREAAESLGYTVIAAEDFGASPSSPQQVCLAGVRDADVVVLLLGARYGTPQSSGLSPTHEEYREARGTKPVLVFVQTGVTPEPGEEKFVEEVGGWEGGHTVSPSTRLTSLRAAVTGALHRWELSQQAGPVNEEELRPARRRCCRSGPRTRRDRRCCTSSWPVHRHSRCCGPGTWMIRRCSGRWSRRPCTGSARSSTEGRECRRASAGHADDPPGNAEIALTSRAASG